MLKTVTITGADHSIDVSILNTLSIEYPFVEWGILFSQEKQGNLRYPTVEWLETLRTLKLNNPSLKLSAHLCGKWVAELCDGNFTFLNYLNEINKIFDRAQLNMTDSRFMSLNFKKIKEDAKTFPKFILQTKRDFVRSEEIIDLNLNNFFDMLYDASGGKGISPNHWAKPVDGIFCGQAGGLGPENIKEQLPILLEIAGSANIWIDMESKVRDQDNKFDISKVEKVLEICQEINWDQVF